MREQRLAKDVGPEKVLLVPSVPYILRMLPPGLGRARPQELTFVIAMTTRLPLCQQEPRGGHQQHASVFGPLFAAREEHLSLIECFPTRHCPPFPPLRFPGPGKSVSATDGGENPRSRASTGP